MASLAIATTRNAVNALTDRDDDLACSVEIADNQIDDLEKEIDELCITLLLLRQQ
ncbi:MAG: hypothetical protein CMO80_18755 [Verrucomicrobiales bacterium]|nr:hypothetical protein [Verrucomicrobiales bacterium]|tara:strand:+ start:971 stop:1135 length:165 start_codon:yes stop_codon:yes gene_type:complete